MLKHFAELLKFKLSVTVVFSATVGYLLGFDNFDVYLMDSFIFSYSINN